MKQYNKINNLLGWVVAAVTALVYILTTEPSASFWDCGEFIATSYKLEVGHPPGAPLFMLLANFFSQFAFGNVEKVALMVNIMSCLAAALTIMFLFWSVTHIARRIITRRNEAPTKAQTALIMGAGLVGALAYAFTDTFWFSAVEAEVYALSSLFTAVVFWAILRWEEVADEQGNERWLVLIAYLMGLSIGVHILNLLTMPALVFVYYFRKTKQVTLKGVVAMTAISGVLILFLNSIVLPYTTQVGAWVDRMLNGIGLPVNVGFTIYAILLATLLGLAVWVTHKRDMKVANIVATCLAMILVGYSSYGSVIIRASANPPMNSNNPDNPYSLLYLLNREQYESQPILSGVHYSAPIEDVTYTTKYYVGDDGKYKADKVISGYTYPDEFKILFPRMWSSKENHIEGYESWGQVSGTKRIRYDGEVYKVPTFTENLRYFFNYQLNFMYWRYFLWNFVGRQSDNQSIGEITEGQWLSGIKPIDEMMLGPQDNLPDDVANNKGRNRYYFLPFILGIIGLLWLLNRSPRYFTVVMWLFLMMGVVLVVYFNSPPGEPRERDYIYAGSFYAFSMWIGFGVLAVGEWLGRLLKRTNKSAVAVGATVVCMCVPTVLIAENWDDHDRSGRYTMRDMGYNLLQTALPNAIVINYGDNDTYPMWYNQEVEGVRPDVRPLNQSYLGGGWYVEEMKYRYNDSEPIPFSFPKSKYMFTGDYIFIEDVVDYRVPLDQAMDVVRSENPSTKLFYGDLTFDFMPQHKLSIPVNKENVLKAGIVKPEDAHLILDSLEIDLKGSTLEKPEVMVLDMIDQLDWSRPIYFVQPTLLKNLGLMDYLQYDGFAYRLVPIRTPVQSVATMGRIDTEYLYDKVMNTFRYGNVKDPDVYVDNFSRYNIASTQIRGGIARLAEALVAEGDNQRAIEVLDRGLEEMPIAQVGHNYQTFPYIDAYYMAGDTLKGDSLARDFAKHITQHLYYYFTFPDSKQEFIVDQLVDKFQYLEHLCYSILLPHGRMELMAVCDQSLEIAELFFGMTRNEKGEPESTVTPVYDATRQQFLDSIEGHFIVE